MPGGRLAQQRLDLGRFVQRRGDIRRQGQRGHAARQRGAQLGGGKAGLRRRAGVLAQHARRQVHQARQHGQARGVDAAVGMETVGGLTDRRHSAIGDEQVLDAVAVVGRVDQAAIGDVQPHAATPASTLKAARRK